MADKERKDRPDEPSRSVDEDLHDQEPPRVPLVGEPLGVGHPVDPDRLTPLVLGEDEPSEGEIALRREVRETRAHPRP